MTKKVCSLCEYQTWLDSTRCVWTHSLSYPATHSAILSLQTSEEIWNLCMGCACCEWFVPHTTFFCSPAWLMSEVPIPSFHLLSALRQSSKESQITQVRASRARISKHLPPSEHMLTLYIANIFILYLTFIYNILRFKIHYRCLCSLVSDLPSVNCIPRSLSSSREVPGGWMPFVRQESGINRGFMPAAVWERLKTNQSGYSTLMLISLQGPIAQKGEVAMPSLLSDLFPISGPYKHSTALLKVCPRGNQAPTGEEKQKQKDPHETPTCKSSKSKSTLVTSVR